MAKNKDMNKDMSKKNLSTENKTNTSKTQGVSPNASDCTSKKTGTSYSNTTKNNNSENY